LDYSFDSDVTALNFSIIESIDEYSTFNQEFRLKGTSEKVDWLAAANVFYQNSDQENNLFGDDFILDQLFLSQFLPEPIGFEPNPFKEETLHSNKNFSSSVFADATWHLNEKLDLTMGMRYSYNKKEIRYTASLGSGQINQTFGLNILTFGEELGAADNTVSESWTAFQPRINLAYKFSDKVMGYGGYSRGYKPGGFSYYLLPVVKPETNNAYEVGLKTTFANGYLNIATFLYDYSNLQLEQFNGFFISVQNAADVRSLGLEAEGSISLGKNITIGGQVAYIDAEYLNFINPLEQDLSGNIPNYTPKWNYGLNAGFYKDIDRVGAFYLQVDYNYQSSMFTESENLEDFKTDVFKQMNIAAGIRGIANGRLDIGIFGQNITNQKYSPLKRDGFGFSYRYVSNPFLGGVTIRLNNILDW
jgi:iron complex outermembrane receptor protein